MNEFRFPIPLDSKALNGAYKVRVVGAEMVASKFGGKEQLCLTCLTPSSQQLKMYVTMTDPTKVKMLLDCGIFLMDGEEEIIITPLTRQPLFWVLFKDGKVENMAPPKQK